MKHYKIMVLEPSGKYYSKRLSYKTLINEYRLKPWLLKRLLRGEEWTITSTIEVFPIGSKVMIQERRPLLERLYILLTTKVNHLFKR